MRLVSLVYLVFGWGALLLGAWILINPNSLGGTDPTMRVPFGILLVAYGLFRLSTGWKKWKDGKQQSATPDGQRQRSFYKGMPPAKKANDGNPTLPQ
jgi:hypothetical protein